MLYLHKTMKWRWVLKKLQQEWMMLYIIVGFDATDDAIEAVKNGEMAAAVAQQPGLIGKTAVDAISKFFAEGKVSSYIPVELKLITK